MTISITRQGDDDNVLADVLTAADISVPTARNTAEAILAAAAEAGVEIELRNDLNMIEDLVAGINAAPAIHLVSSMGSSVVGKLLTIVGDGGGIGSDAPITGQKAFAAQVHGSPATGAELEFGFMSPDAVTRCGVFINGITTPAKVYAGLAGGSPVDLHHDHVDGDTYAVWRNSATGAWGVVLPDGTDSGDLTTAAGGKVTGDAIAFAANSFGATQTATVIETGVTLPAGYSLQAFA